MELQQIDRVTTLSKKEFMERYVKPQQPVVMTKLIEDWPAHTKWSLDYIKSQAGDLTVPLYDNRPVSHDEGFNQAHATMQMSDYVDLLKKEPTNYRIFLYNLMKEVPLQAKTARSLCTTILTGLIFYTFTLKGASNASFFHLLRRNTYIRSRTH